LYFFSQLVALHECDFFLEEDELGGLFHAVHVMEKLQPKAVRLAFLVAAAFPFFGKGFCRRFLFPCVHVVTPSFYISMIYSRLLFDFPAGFVLPFFFAMCYNKRYDYRQYTTGWTL
jgi:hypothetical protein